MSGTMEPDAFIAQMQSNLSSMVFTAPLTVIADDLRKTHQGYFDTQTAPNGVAWAPLAPATIKRRFSRDMGGNPRGGISAGFTPDETILIDTGAMKSSTVFKGNRDHVETIGPALLEWGTKDEKAAIHQFGAGKIPARPFVGWNEPAINSATEHIADAAVTQLLIGL